MIREISIQSLLQGAVIVLFIWNILLFSVALRSGFSRPHGVPGRMRILALCGAVATLADGILLFLAKPLPWQTVAGLALQIASQFLLRAAIRATTRSKLSLAFSDDAPASLNQSGPYRFIRHPFYTAYSLTWLAAAVATAHPAAFAALVMMVAFYWVAARREEKKFLSSPLADSYRCYRKSAGMFFPNPLSHKSNTTPNT